MSWEELRKRNERKYDSWTKLKERNEKKKFEKNHPTVNENDDNTFFKKSNFFDDGYQFGDVAATITGTVGDIGTNVGKGIAKLGEGLGDVISYGIADIYDWTGNDSKAESIRKRAQQNVIEDITKPAEDFFDEYSVLGEKSDSISEGLGYVAGITAVSVVSRGAGAALGSSSVAAATIGSTATTFTSAMGNGISEALKDGANIDEARLYGAISGAAEAGSELMFGGLGKASKAIGLSKGALDDVITNGLTKNIKNKMVKTLTQSGIKASGEGLEEVVSGLISAVGKKATYMNEKELKQIVKDENLAEQFWMGALTSAIAQGPSTFKSIRSGTDYVTGRTKNEQKVYENELDTRKDEKVRKLTTEKAYNEQIKIQENLGIKVTEDLKRQIMQKVENAYNNGNLETMKLNKKEILQIEDEVEKDMQDGNISADNIIKVLGENKDISNDKLLMKSMYENEQQYNSYKVEKTDNEKVNILMQSAADSGMNNTSKTRKKVELISKLVKDTDRQYKFVSPEQLKQMGYNEKANGLINKLTGEILINAHSDKGLQSIVGHETTHIFDSKVKGKGKHAIAEYTKEYQTLQNAVIEYAKVKGVYDSKLQSITEAYGDLLTNEKQVKEELTADLVGDFLFNDEKFIENLATKDKNVFQKIYDYVKHTYKMMVGTDEEKAFENLKNKFEKVYKNIPKETETDIKYSIAGKEGMKNAIKTDAGYLKLERNYKKAQQMQKNGTDNETIRKTTAWFQDKNGDWKFEFSDKDMSLKNIKLEKNKTYKLGDLLEHDTLFTVYPELANYSVKFENIGASGAFRKAEKLIRINSNKLNLKNSKMAIEGTMIHEIQHAIQNIEGFEEGRGSNFKLAYYKSLGEIEADNTKKRYMLEKNGKLDRTIVAPESSKSNPRHSNLDNYLKNRKFLDKIKDSVYNGSNDKNKKGGDSYEIYQNDKGQNNQENSNLVFERANRNRRPNGILGNRGTENRENGRKATNEVQEVDTKIQSRNEKIKNTAYENEEKNNRQIWNNIINNSNIRESENNSGSFLKGKNQYSLTNSQTTGDDISVKDMLVKERPTIEKEVGKTKKQSIEENLLNNKQVNSKELQDKYKQMAIGKRQYEKLLRKEKPTEKEKITVDRLLKGEIENDEIPKSVNRQRVVDLYNAKVKFYNTEKEIQTKRKEIVQGYRNLAKEMTKNIMSWKDKKKGIQYQINTMKRNLRDVIPDKNEADAVYDEYFKPITKNNALIEKETNKYNERIEKLKVNNIESQYIQMIGEGKYNPEFKLPKEKVEEFYNNHKTEIDIKKCENAVEELRNIYDELIVKINDVLMENGYKPIEYRKGYFPHFIENKPETFIGKVAEKMGWKINKDTLPTDIAGITDQFKPGKRWTSFSQQRKSDSTDYDALKGFDNYIRGAMDVIYHTKDIQKLRALENEIRYQYNEKGIQEKIDNIYNEHEIDIEEKQQKINEILDNVQNNPMGNLATELRNYTNNLANKKETSDRGMEQAFGRETYSIMANIQNRVSANMIGANIASALTNFIPITQAWSQTSTKNIMKGIKEGIAIQFNDDGFIDNSTFLTNRTKQADRLYKTGLDKVNDKLGYMFDVVDSFTSNVIVRAKYYDNIEAGMNTTDAMDNADEFAKDVIAGRSKGDMPTIFNKKNPLMKLFTAFQLEVNNQYGYMLKDLPADLGGEAKEKLVGAFVKMFLGAYLYNMISEKLTGRKSAFSPIDIALNNYNTITNDDIKTSDKVKTITTDLIGEVPFIGGIAGGGRLPIQGAIPYDNPLSAFTETTSNVIDFFDGDEIQKQTAIKSLLKEWSKPVYYMALPFAGGQLKKTIEGISMYLNEVPGSYTNSGDLRYTVEDNVGNKIKAGIFGAYANPYAQDYINSGFKTIKKDNIEEMVGLDMNSTEYRKYRKELNQSSKTQDKLKYIDSLGLTNEQKNIAANNINKNSKKTIDMKEYGKYSSYEEYKYARDYPNKYSVISQITDYDKFNKYKKDIANIKNEYSEESGYESSQRKSVVQSYINGLDLEVHQKMMLEKMAGGYSIKNYRSYIKQYLDSTNLKQSEKYTIWEELFE